MKRVFLVILILGAFCRSEGQSLMGHTGLVTIPTARMQEDGSLSFGASYFDQKYQEYSDYKYNVGALYANVTFLPFLEVTLRVNRMFENPSKTYTVDRVPMIRLRLWKEKTLLPAVVLGVHDFFASFGGEKAKHYNATYLVMSKKISRLDFHLGYSPKLMEAGGYQLNGLFYGAAYSPFKWMELMGEYDSRIYNTGVRLNFLKHFSLTASLINGDSYAGGLNYRIKL